MFQKPLIKLIIWNSSIFLLIFVLFGYTLYRYVADETFNDVDDALRRRAQVFLIGRERLPGRREQLGFLDPRIFVFWHDETGHLFSESPLPMDDLDGIAEAIAVLGANPQTRHISSHTYRLWRQSVPKPSADMADIITVALIDSEAGVLLHLFNIIIVSLLSGGVISAVAGYFLAKRALIPIQAAWDKQQRFVADASHELRTPIAVIQSSAELLLRHPAHTIEQELRRVTAILSEALRMGNLVGTLLTLARADANRLELQLSRFEVTEIITEVVEQFRSVLETKEIKIKVQIDEPLEIWGDRERLRQMVIIFLDNAVKYTESFGNIWIGCHKEQESVLFMVTDTGCGIFADDLPFVFDRFFRGDKGRCRESGGTGLGLAIAQWIIKQHGGKVRIESEQGKGTRVSVLLPLTPHS